MSSLMPPENRKLISSGSPITIRPPVRALRMFSIPSRKAVPGATISSAFINPGSGRASLSKSSPDLDGTTRDFRAFRLALAPPRGVTRRWLGRGGRSPRPSLRQYLVQSLSQRAHLARAAAATGGCYDVTQTMPGGLLHAALGVPHPAQLPRQTQLAKAGPRRSQQGQATARTGH